MRFLYFTLFCLWSLTTLAQHHHHHHHEHYARVKVHLSEAQPVHVLAQLGVDVEHGTWERHEYLISDFSETEVRQIELAGFETEILIPDVQAHYADQSARQIVEERGGADCNGEQQIQEYKTPENFALGSMAGFFTYEEMLNQLDLMTEQYPHLLSPRMEIDSIRTHQDRPIYWLRLSDNPNTDEDEPEVLYTALHHAREPAGLSQLIFYLWYLLENYETDAEIRYLVDHTEMYFIPCINPDGYIFNQTERPGGGGMHRKNMRVNENGSIGVDLNRNYGFSWAYDDSGSSPNQHSATYRGTAPFSEPETQAVRNFCNAHQFRVALNYHTYGNLLIYPWGYLDTPTEDAPTFNALSKAMIGENEYTVGTGTETVGYTVNGDSDDWMYGETESKPKIYAMTPEVGGNFDGFWPSMGRIEILCKEALLMNLVTANVAHTYPSLEELSVDALVNLENSFQFNLKNVGLEDGEIMVDLIPLSENVETVEDAKTYSLASLEEVEGGITFRLRETIENEAEVVFLLRIDNGSYMREDTLRKTFYCARPVFADAADNIDLWEGNWQTTTEKFVSPPSAITDSPEEDYGYNIRSTIELKEAIPLDDVINLRLRFYAQWELERGDYVQVSANLGDSGYFPLCSENTDEIVRGAYLGVQENWIYEDIDLSEYLSFSEDIEAPFDIKIQFELRSDGYREGDGFYIDDIELVVVREGMTNILPLEESNLDYHAIPNPAKDAVYIQLDRFIPNAKLYVYNSLGQRIINSPIQDNNLRINTSTWASGIYFYQLEVDGVALESKRLVINK